MERIRIVTVTLLLGWFGTLMAAGETTRELFERAVYTESTVGDMNAAEKLYRQIIDEEKANRPLTAQSYYHLSMLLIKSEKEKEALSVLEALAKDFPDQTDLIEKSQAALASYLSDRPTRNLPDSWFFFDSRETGHGPVLAMSFDGKTEEISASQDVLLIQYLSERIFGAHRQLSININDKNRVLAQFNLPAGHAPASLTKAELVLNVTMSEIRPVDPVNIALCAVSAQWDEAQTSWMTQPAFDTKPEAVTVVFPRAGTVRFDITNLVRRWMDGSLPNNGVLIRVASPGYGPAPWDTSPTSGKYTAEEVAHMDVNTLFKHMIYGEVGRQYFAGLWALMVKGEVEPACRAEIVSKATGILSDKTQHGYARWLCCFVLSGLHDTNSLPLLETVLVNDPDTGVREGAASALGEFDSEDARRILREKETAETNERVHVALEKALSGEGRITAKREYLGTQAVSGQEGGATKRYDEQAVRSKSVEELFKCIASPEAGYHQFSGLWGLIDKAKNGDENTCNEILASAKSILEDPAKPCHQRWQTCYVLSGIGDPRGVALVEEALEKDPYATVRAVAACALGEFGTNEARTALTKARDTEQDPKVIEDIAKALAKSAPAKPEGK